MNRILAFAVVSIMIMSTGCIGGESSTTRNSFETRSSFLNVDLLVDRMISDNKTDSTYCTTLRRLLDRDDTALSAISQSAANNPEHAYLLAAYYYRDGDYESMLQHLRAAVRLPQARCDLGLCHKLGIGTLRDPKLAQKRFEEASKAGCTEADYYLTRSDILTALYYYYATAIIDSENIAAIIGRLHRPADSGNAHACYYLGVCYYLQSVAESTPQSEMKAIKYLTSAAHDGIPEAIEMVNEYNDTNKIRQLQYAFIIDNDYARTAYMQGSYLYIKSIDEPDKEKRKDMLASAINYLRTASKLGIRQATEMVYEYASTEHIYQLEHLNTQIIRNDNYALDSDGNIILD